MTLRSVDRAGKMAIVELPFDGPPGVDHAWHVAVTGASIDGTIELFYRNDYGYRSVGIRAENWFVSDHPLTGQDDLELVRVGPDGRLTLAPGRVNPLANKVEADITLDEGTTVLALVLRGDLLAPGGP